MKYIKVLQKIKKLIEADGPREDIIPGGLADNKQASDFNPESLAEGVKVESEHTNVPEIAQEISKDHLTEDPNYYKKLAEMEKTIPTSPNSLKQMEKHNPAELPQDKPTSSKPLANGLTLHTYQMGGLTKHHIADKSGKGVGVLDVMSIQGKPTVSESYVRPAHRGKGLGKALYEHALAHHGNLQSDTHTSAAADKVWEYMLSKPNVSGNLGAAGTDEKHSIELQKSEPFVKKATRLIKMNNRNNPPELEILNWNEGQEIAHHIGSKTNE